MMVLHKTRVLAHAPLAIYAHLSLLVYAHRYLYTRDRRWYILTTTSSVVCNTNLNNLCIKYV